MRRCGADGADGADLTMQLHNADGGEAEMSGNGIRCLAQAAVDAGWVTPPTFSVATAGGVRTVTFRPGEEAGLGQGQRRHGRGRRWARPAQEFDGRNGPNGRCGQSAPGAGRARGRAGRGRVEIDTRGPQLQAAYPGGINVEWIELAHDADGDFLELRVWERGAGETLACGTGSVAAAAVARAVELVGGTGPVRVHNPGGMLEVTLGRAAG